MDEEVAREYIAFASQLSSTGCYSKSYDLYLMAFEKNPRLKAVFEPEFRGVLNKLNEILAHTGKIEDIFLNFGKAIKLYPDNIHLLNDTGKYLYKFGYYKEAWCHFQKAMKMDSGFVNAEKNLNSIKNLLIERWHFRMLNDNIRNEAYHSAIKETVIPYKESILDLGCGTGLLTLYSMECHPMAMTACDSCEQMVKMTECILEDNKYDEVIVINTMSNNMDFRDIGGKRSLLVTEMFDAGLFGEHILKALSHAHEQLISNVGRILPNKAEFFVMGAKCDHLHQKYQLTPYVKSLLNIPTENVHILMEDTYDCEDVYMFKDLKYMTEPKSLINIDFNSYNDIQEKITETEPYTVEFKALENGEINCVIGWFNLYLTDNVTLTTDPRSDQVATAWQQAVFYDYIPEKVTENQTVNMNFLLNGGELTLVPNTKNEIIKVSPEVLRFLNDSEYIKMITRCLGMASVYLGQMSEMSQISIVDLCPFPMFGLLMLKRGVKSVTCCAKSDNDVKFFKNIFKANNIPPSRVNLLFGDEWTQDSFLDERYHAVFCNILELCGDVDLRIHEIAQHLKNAHLVHGGLFMPASISLVGQVVSSHWLDVNNRVYDKNVSNYKIGMYINKYQVSQNFCVDFTCLEYTGITEPVVLGKYGNEMSGVVNVPVVTSGEANAILCWYNIELMEEMGEISTKRGNSFIDGTVFLANPAIQLVRGGIANVLRCIDHDGAFKLMIDAEAV